MTPFPPIPPSELTDEQRKAHDFWCKNFGDNFSGGTFIDKGPDGSLLGPMAPALRTPSLALAMFNMIGELGKLPGLSRLAREVAILATGSHYQALFEIYSHERLAVANTDLTQTQIDLIKQSRKPADLNEESSVAYDTAMRLVKMPGPLPHEQWLRAEKVLGKEGTLALVHFIGFYSYLCVVLNGTQVPLPKGESIK